MGKIKVLNSDSETFKVLEEVNGFLNQKGVYIIRGIFDGLIYQIDGEYFRYMYDDNTYCNELPPAYEGRFVLCDYNGNIIEE